MEFDTISVTSFYGKFGIKHSAAPHDSLTRMMELLLIIKVPDHGKILTSKKYCVLLLFPSPVKAYNGLYVQKSLGGPESPRVR